MESIGIRRFILYCIPLTLIYIIVLILIDNSGFKPVGTCVLRMSLSLVTDTALMTALYAVISDNRRK